MTKLSPSSRAPGERVLLRSRPRTPIDEFRAREQSKAGGLNGLGGGPTSLGRNVGVEPEVLTGDGDHNSTAQMAREMAEAAPHGEARIIEGHRHMVALTAPSIVNEALTSWLCRRTHDNV